MKKILAVLVALAMLVTFASAGDQWDYIKKVYIDPNKFETLPAGYELVDGQYSFLKMVATPTRGDAVITNGLVEEAYSQLQFGEQVTTGSGLLRPPAITGYVNNLISTSVSGKVVSDQVNQLIWQNGEGYYGSRIVDYNPQNPPATWKYDEWAGYSRDQGAIMSGDVQDCTDPTPVKTPSYTVKFIDPIQNAQVGVGPVIHEDIIAPDTALNQITVRGPNAANADFALGEAWASQSVSADVKTFPQQGLSLDGYADLTFEASYSAGGMADLGPIKPCMDSDMNPYDNTALPHVEMDFSNLNQIISNWWTES